MPAQNDCREPGCTEQQNETGDAPSQQAQLEHRIRQYLEDNDRQVQNVLEE